MPMYKWNVRTVRISHDYIEEIVEARTAREAHDKVYPEGYADSDDGWVVDYNPELFINGDFTERMDKLFPDDYSNPDDEGTLHIPEFAQGVLFAWSQEIYTSLLDTGEDDYWEVVHDVPMFGAEHREYESYDLNFWKDEDTGKWHCTAYAIWYDEAGNQHTKTDEWLRLW